MKTFTAENFDIDALLKKGLTIVSWEPITFGEYEGLTIPQLFFRNPGYFYWALSVKAFKGMLKLQADAVEARVRKIRLPTKSRGECLFLVKIKNDRFNRFEIVSKRFARRRLSADRYAGPFLDFSLVSAPDFETEYPRRLMMAGLVSQFFDRDADQLRKRDCEMFLGDPANFYSGSYRKTCPSVKRWDHPDVLELTLSRESKGRHIPEQVVRRMDAAMAYRWLMGEDC